MKNPLTFIDSLAGFCTLVAGGLALIGVVDPVRVIAWAISIMGACSIVKVAYLGADHK